MAATYEKGQLYQLKLRQLIPDPEQPRKFFDEQALSKGQAYERKLPDVEK